jgi:hypothetical protein
MRFCAIGSANGRPIVLDDTCYFLSCGSKDEADFFADLLNSQIAQEFLSSLVFRDAKRPITVDVLRRLDLLKLGEMSLSGILCAGHSMTKRSMYAYQQEDDQGGHGRSGGDAVDPQGTH